MISSVSIDAGGKTHTLRMNTRAMMAIEQRLDAGLVQILEGVQDDPRVGTLVLIIQECMNDGQGASEDAAQGLMDALGFAQAAKFIGEITQAAFPEASTEKN